MMERFSHNSRTTSPCAVVVAVVALLIVVPFLTAAQEGTPEGAAVSEEMAPDPTPTPVPPTPTLTPIPPTPTPEPTPTSIPPTSTLEPTLTPEHTPISSPSTPAPESSPDTEPTATSTPTPDDEATGTLTCDTEYQTEIEPGGTAEMPCTYTALTDGEGATVTAAFERDPGDGWSIAINDGIPGTTATWTPDKKLDPGSRVNLTVRVTAPIDAEPAQKATIMVSDDGDWNGTATWTLTVAKPKMTLAEAGDFSQLAVVDGYDCPFSNYHVTQSRFLCGAIRPPYDGNTFYVDIVSVSDGWLLAHDNGNSWSSLPEEDVIVQPDYLSSFWIDLKPDPTADPPAPYMGTAVIRITERDAAGTIIDSVDVTLTAYNGGPPQTCTPTVSAVGVPVDFGTSTWNGSAYPPVSKSIGLQVTITEDGCAGMPTEWIIQALASDMTGPGEVTIPAASISFVASDGGPPPGLIAEPGSSLATTQTIASGTAEFNSGDVWNAMFTVDPPDDRPTGEYSGTITITVGSAGP